MLQEDDVNDHNYGNYSALKNVRVQDLSLIMTTGYNETRFCFPNVVNEFIKTIAIMIVVLHEFGPSLQQWINGSGQHWKLEKHCYSCKKSWKHIT